MDLFHHFHFGVATFGHWFFLMMVVLLAVALAYTITACRRLCSTKQGAKLTAHASKNFAYESIENDVMTHVDMDAFFKRCRDAEHVSVPIEDVTELNRTYPVSFFIPSEAEREMVKERDWVKLMFRTDGILQHEFLWVAVDKKLSETSFEGVLVEASQFRDADVAIGLRISFGSRHIARLGVTEEHEHWINPRLLFFVSKLPMQQKALRYAEYTQPIEKIDVDNGSQDSGWALLCGGEDGADSFTTLYLPQVLMLCPQFQQLLWSHSVSHKGKSVRFKRSDDVSLFTEIK